MPGGWIRLSLFVIALENIFDSALIIETKSAILKLPDKVISARSEITFITLWSVSFLISTIALVLSIVNPLIVELSIIKLANRFRSSWLKFSPSPSRIKLRSLWMSDLPESERISNPFKPAINL